MTTPDTRQSIISYLEMTSDPCIPQPTPAVPLEDISIVQVHNITISFYRYLYNTVGEPYMWQDRRKINDSALEALIRKPGVEIYVMYVKGCPAGWYELDCSDPKNIEITYFGLFPEFYGKKLGPWLLNHIVKQVWSRKPNRLWVHTCSLDHPAALRVYEQQGFVKYKEEIVYEPIPDWFRPYMNK